MGIVKRLQGTRIRSIGTARNYQERLVQIAARLDMVLTALTPERAVAYLEDRAAQVGQKTLDMERQAIQAMMVNVTGQLPPGATLPVVKSSEPHKPKPRRRRPRLMPRPLRLMPPRPRPRPRLMPPPSQRQKPPPLRPRWRLLRPKEQRSPNSRRSSPPPKPPPKPPKPPPPKPPP